MFFFRTNTDGQQDTRYFEAIWILLKKVCNPFVIIPEFCSFVMTLRQMELDAYAQMMEDQNNDEDTLPLPWQLGR